MVSAFIATAFTQPDHGATRTRRQGNHLVADQMRGKLPKLTTLMDGAEEDVLAYMTFLRQHRTKLHSTNPIERLYGEIKRRTNIVGIYLNEPAMTASTILPIAVWRRCRTARTPVAPWR